MSYKINNVEVSAEEIRKLVKNNPEILKDKSFEEEMVGKNYWFSTSSGYKESSFWDDCTVDNWRLSINNAFFSEAECDKELSRRKALGRIMKYIRDNKIKLVKDEDWGNNYICKYQISGWDYLNNYRKTDYYYSVDYSQHNLAFYSQEDLNKVVSNCQEDLKLLLKR